MKFDEARPKGRAFVFEWSANERFNMGYDLEGIDGSSWGTTSVGWRFAHYVAELFGWHPAGTTPPEDWEDACVWSGDYMANLGQQVTTSDAAAFALALRSALASPKFDSLVTAFGAEFQAQLAAASTDTVKLTVRPFVPEECRRALRAFAAFCERGAFKIY